MARKALPPAAVLRQLLRYEPETGKLFWRHRPDSPSFSTRWAGVEAFTTVERGYRQGRVFAQLHYAHRIIWRMMTDEIADDVDHINGDRSDNRWENLRHVSRRENMRNRCLSRRNRTGHPGVYKTYWGAWQAYIGNEGKAVCLGAYKTKAAAVEARRTAEKTLGYHENHGRPFDPGLKGAKAIGDSMRASVKARL